MANIPDLFADFDEAAVGQPASGNVSVFNNVSGTGTSTLITDPFDASRRMMEVTTAANFRIHEMDIIPPIPLLWFRFDLDIETTLDSATALISGFDDVNAVNKVFDLRQSAGARTLQLRNVNTSVWVSNALAADTKYRVYLYMKVDSSKQIRCIIYDGTDFTNVFQDSGFITSTTAATGVGHIRVGNQSSSTGVIRFGRFRGDDAEQTFDTPPAPPGGTVWSRGITVSIGG